MARRRHNLSLRGWVFVTLAFVAWAITLEGLELRMARAARTTDAAFVATVRASKGGTSCLFQYVVDGKPFQIASDCDDRPSVAVDYLPEQPTVARVVSRRGEYRNIALILAFASLGAFGAVIESLRDRARLRALGQGFRSEGAVPSRKR